MPLTLQASWGSQLLETSGYEKILEKNGCSFLRMFNQQQHASFYPGLQRMIFDKEVLQPKRDQLVECLPVLLAKLARMANSRLGWSKRNKKMVHSQDATQLHVELAELKIKWAELQDVVTSTTEHESASMERIKNLEVNLLSKTKEATAIKEKRAKMAERL
nr:uncharacterized protein LOC117281356 [Nicotiana tomentosiformis]